MAKPTLRMKDHSGQEHKTYLYEGTRIEVLPYFLYEVSIYKYWNSGACMLGSKFFKSDKLLNLKYYRKVENHDGFSIEKEVTLMGAPSQFIREKKLPEYKPIIKTKKLRKNETVR